jgi:hypothetical protein
MPSQVYAWTILNTSMPWRSSFNSSGDFARYTLRFSLSGVPQKEDLRVELDGNDAHWVPAASIGRDRWHYDIPFHMSLAKGEHKIAFVLKNSELEQAQLCSVEVLEFGDKHEWVNHSIRRPRRLIAGRFNTTPGFVGAFPTFSDDNQWVALCTLHSPC